MTTTLPVFVNSLQDETITGVMVITPSGRFSLLARWDDDLEAHFAPSLTRGSSIRFHRGDGARLVVRKGDFQRLTVLTTAGSRRIHGDAE